MTTTRTFIINLEGPLHQDLAGPRAPGLLAQMEDQPDHYLPLQVRNRADADRLVAFIRQFQPQAVFARSAVG